MKSFISIVTLSLASLVWTAPTTPVGSNDALAKRTPGNVRLCTGSGFTNTCATVAFALDTCVKIPEPWFESVGSIGPDQGALCRLTTSSTTGCTAHGDLFIQFPGFSDLYNHGGVDYGHSARFMDCQTCTACT